MKQLTNIKNALAISLILFGIILSTNKPSNNNVDIDTNILQINKPSSSIVSKVNPISQIITDPSDRIKLAIFNQEFAKRVLGYDTDNQKLNDVYVLAASHFFGNSINGEYEELDRELIGLLESIIGDKNHILTTQEKTNISENFLGLAWSLTQKR